jgi:hypothetical protein
MGKVVYNACFGGFSISKECAEKMAELGNDEAKEILADYHKRQFERPTSGFSPFSSMWYGYLRETPRHDETLVKAVEALGAEASGSHAKLEIEELPPNTLYRIDEYDGSESVMTQSTYDWILCP